MLWKANETILTLDLKAASKEQALCSTHTNDEIQEIDTMKRTIQDLAFQRERDVAKIQVRSLAAYLIL